MKVNHLFYLAGVFCFFASCENDSGEDENFVRKEIFSGYVQKGPFISGSSVSVFELDINLDQTGRNYSTTIIDNSGNFEQKNIELVSNYVQLKADGYYFNEITGKSSTGQISLYALTDIVASNAANVNVLTHLERSRVEYLMKEGKRSFTEAKKQAKKEVLNIFSMDIPDETTSESLSLTSDAILPAISSIIQGRLSTADMVELMANISADIQNDGKLDNMDLGSRLIDNALNLSLPDIRKNLETKYSEIGTGIKIPDFESYVRLFIENTSYKPSTVPPGENPLPEDSILFLIKDKTFNILHGPCGSIIYQDRIGKDFDSALDSLIKKMIPYHGLSQIEYYIDSEMITVDFNYDDRKFYSIGFRRKANDMYIFAISHVIDSNGNCFNILWCDD
jgi:hypothetical protein